jgi:RNA polymerase sigma-70 factor, ECF subfamily
MPSTGSPNASLCAANAAMERYAMGHDDAFAIVYDTLVPRIHRFLLRSTQDKAKAEDLLQQTFLRMHRARGRFIRGASVLTWSFAIAKRLFVDDLRHAARRPSTADHEGAASTPVVRPDQLLEAQRTVAAIHDTLARLPPSQRLAFELVKWEGLSLAEVADVLGTTVPAVKALTHRAYRAVQDELRSPA